MKKIKNFISKHPVRAGALISICILCLACYANSELITDPENPHVNIKANWIHAWGETGLGTDDPLARLHVLSSNAPVTILDLNNTTDWLTMDFRRQGERTASFGVSASDAYGGNAFVLGSYKTDWTNPLIIEQGAPTESLYIKSNGNVGLGTTAPDHKLTIEGSDAIKVTAGAGGLLIKKADACVDSLAMLDIQDDTGTSYFKVDRGKNIIIDGNLSTTGLIHLISGPSGGKIEGYNPSCGNNSGGIKFKTRNGGTGNYDDRLVIECGNVWAVGNVSALSFTDRTPYPKDLKTAYEAVLSMQRLPNGQYDENNKEQQLDHSLLSPFLKSSDGFRDLSATVSAQNEVIKDLINRIEKLEAKLKQH